MAHSKIIGTYSYFLVTNQNRYNSHRIMILFSRINDRGLNFDNYNITIGVHITWLYMGRIIMIVAFQRVSIKNRLYTTDLNIIIAIRIIQKHNLLSIFCIHRWISELENHNYVPSAFTARRQPTREDYNIISILLVILYDTVQV